MFITPPLKWPISPACVLKTSVTDAAIRTRRAVFTNLCLMDVLLFSSVSKISKSVALPSMSSPNLWRRSITVIISVEAFVGGQEWDVGLHGSLGHISQCERLGCFHCEDLEPLLHRGDFVRIGASEVVLFVRIFGDVVELDVGWKYRSPD